MADIRPGPWEFWPDLEEDMEEDERCREYIVGRDLERSDPEDRPYMYEPIAERVVGRNNAAVIAKIPEMYEIIRDLAAVFNMSGVNALCGRAKALLATLPAEQPRERKDGE